MRIKHIAIRVKDLEQSVRFYETITDLTVARRLDADPAQLAFLSNEAGETELELVYIPESQTYEGKSWFICFEVDAVTLQIKHQLAEANGLNPSPIHDPGDQSVYFYVYDPNGVSVQLRVFPK